jgi:hypothetical protein
MFHVLAVPLRRVTGVRDPHILPALLSAAKTGGALVPSRAMGNGFARAGCAQSSFCLPGLFMPYRVRLRRKRAGAKLRRFTPRPVGACPAPTCHMVKS